MGSKKSNNNPITRLNNIIPGITILIPTLNEEPNIAQVLDELMRFRSFFKEIIIVDNCSTDKTVDICRKYPVRIIEEKRKGKGIAIKAGVKSASNDFVIVMDADGSHRPEEIPLIIEKLAQNHDLVKGSRFTRGGGTYDMTPLRKMGNLFLLSIINLWGAKYTDLCYGYIGFKKHVFERFMPNSDGFDTDVEFAVKIFKNRLKVCEFPSIERGRYYGNPKGNVFKVGLKDLRTVIRELLLTRSAHAF